MKMNNLHMRGFLTMFRKCTHIFIKEDIITHVNWCVIRRVQLLDMHCDILMNKK